MDGFPPGGQWFNGPPKGRGAFDPKKMARVLFGDCDKQDICVKRPTLHDIDEVAEVAALNSASFHEELKAYAEEGSDYGWSIAIAPSVQHFKPPGFSDPDHPVDGGSVGVCEHSGAYTPGAHANPTKRLVG